MKGGKLPFLIWPPHQMQVTSPVFLPPRSGATCPARKMTIPQTTHISLHISLLHRELHVHQDHPHVILQTVGVFQLEDFFTRPAGRERGWFLQQLVSPADSKQSPACVVF